MPFAIGNTRQQERWMDEYLDLDVKSYAGSVPLTGRALLVGAPFNLASHFNVEGGTATVALCHVPLKLTAQPGDVVFFAANGPSKKYGLRNPCAKPLLLAVGVVEETMLPSTYNGNGCPDWAVGRRDRIYIAEVMGAALRDKAGHLGRLERASNGKNPRIAAVAPVGSPAHTFRVRMKCDTVVQFGLRSRARFHKPGFPRWKRKHDFTGRVLAFKTFAAFPGDSSDSRAKWLLVWEILIRQ